MCYCLCLDFACPTSLVTPTLPFMHRELVQNPISMDGTKAKPEADDDRSDDDPFGKQFEDKFNHQFPKHIDKSKYVVQINKPLKPEKDTTTEANRDPIHKALHKHLAKYTDTTGMFINDDFIKDLVWNTTKPKAMTEQLRQASVGPNNPNDHFVRAGDSDTIVQKGGEIPVHGGKAHRGKVKRKLVDSKNPKVKNAAQRTLRQHFKTPITFDMFETELQSYLKECNFTPEYCCYTTCFDPTGPEPPIMFDRRKHTAFNNRRTPFALGGLGGLPMGLTGMKAVANQCPPGGRIVLIHGTHIGIDDRGSLGAVDFHDKKTDVYLHAQSCEAVVKMYKQLLNFGREKAMETSLDKRYEEGMYSLHDVLKHHVHDLNYTSEEPYVHLPYILYEEQRERLLRIVEKAVDGKSHVLDLICFLTTY